MPLSKHLYKRAIRKRLENESVSIDCNGLMDAWKRSHISDLSLLMIDREYRAIPRDLLDDILERSTVDRKQFLTNWKDSDDFARMLWAECSWVWCSNFMGLVIDRKIGHSYNAALIVDNDGQINMTRIEPQTDLVGDNFFESYVVAGSTETETGLEGIDFNSPAGINIIF